MAKVERTLQRKDGTEIKIVAQTCFGMGLTRSIDVYVLVRQSPAHQWRVASDRPHPDWRKMSVADYIKSGRSEMLRLVAPGEILSVVNTLGLS